MRRGRTGLASHVVRLGEGRYRVFSGSTAGKWYLVQVAGGRASCNCTPSIRAECYHERTVLRMATETEYAPVDEENSLVPIAVQRPIALLPTRDEYNLMVVIARDIASGNSAVLPKGMQPREGLAVMMAGHALGVPPFVALRHMVIVNNRIEPDAQLMMGIVQAADPAIEFRWTMVSFDECRLELWRGSKFLIKTEYTRYDAERAGQLAVKMRPIWAKDAPKGARPIGEEPIIGPWQTHTNLMLAYNCIKIAIKLAVPSLLHRIVGVTGNMAPELLESGESDHGPTEQLDGPDSFGRTYSATVENPPPPRQATNDNWQDTPAPENQQTQTRNRRQVLEELNAELKKQACAPDAVSRLVGGGSINLAIAWMDEHKASIAAMVSTAKRGAEAGVGEGGELPNVFDAGQDSVEGEARDVTHEEQE